MARHQIEVPNHDRNENIAAAGEAYTKAMAAAEKAHKEALAAVRPAYEKTKQAAWQTYYGAVAAAGKVFNEAEAVAWDTYTEALKSLDQNNQGGKSNGKTADRSL